MSDIWLSTLITSTPQTGYDLAIKNWAEAGAVQKNWQSGPSGGQFGRTALGNVPHRKCAFATFWCWGQNHPMSMPVTPIIADIVIGILVKTGVYRQNLGG